MHCTDCGKPNHETARFCAHCGSELTTPPAETAAEVLEADKAMPEDEEPAAEAEEHEETPEEAAAREAELQRQIRMVKIISIAGSFTIIGPILGYFVYKGLIRTAGALKYQKKNAMRVRDLIVVTAVTAVLAAILFPVFAKAREKARQTSCLSNEKQLMVALEMYSLDYDEKFTLAPWCDNIYPYTKNREILRCPAAPRLEYGYALNDAVLEQSMGALTAPSETVALFDADGGPNSTGGLELLARRHMRGADFGYMDGHCKFRMDVSPEALKIDPQ
jgi:type II secretory pathway pseudopilin PulG